MTFEELERLESFQTLVNALEQNQLNQKDPTPQPQRPKSKSLLKIFNDGTVERN